MLYMLASPDTFITGDLNILFTTTLYEMCSPNGRNVVSLSNKLEG